jgi:hypothetical protein
MNCNVLAGEMKHKFFHRLADTASPSNLMAYLFAHDATRQSIRLGLAGAWSYDYPVLQEPLKHGEKFCPKLTKSFLPLSERDDVDILDEAAIDEVDELQVVEDEMHTHVSVKNGKSTTSATSSNSRKSSVLHVFSSSSLYTSQIRHISF